MTCSICNDYLQQMRKASADYDDDRYWSVKELYLAHLRDKHPFTQVRQPVDREKLRQAFGRLGER